MVDLLIISPSLNRAASQAIFGAMSSRPAQRSAVTDWLQRQGTGVFMGYAVLAAFATYFCMYAFRKPFAVGTYLGRAELPLVGAVDYKILFIVAQVFGYCTSKFAGIKIVSEMSAAGRARAILLAIAVAEAALLLFGVVPRPYNAVCLFFNGLPLGLVWGLVFGFLEGRTTSDALGAGLCASFILASGFVKSVGKMLLDAGVAEVWMPAATGALFVVPMVLFVWMLAQLPPPSEQDEKQRLRREPMDGKARVRFVKAILWGLVSLTIAYVLLTAYRDFRDNFAREIWDALGYADEPLMMTYSEIPVAFGALLAVAAVWRIRDNKKALLFVHGLMLFGALLIGSTTLLYQAGLLGPDKWMVAVGLGLYVGYVPYNCVLFDRLIPAVGMVGTAGFLIYVTDAFGYLGSVALLLFKNFGHPDLSWLSFFVGFSHACAWIGAVLFVASGVYFYRRGKAQLADA